MSADIVSSLSGFIAPYLPALMSAGAHFGKGVMEEAGKQTGSAGFEYAKQIWHKLFPGIAHREAELAAISQAGGDAQALAPIVQGALTNDHVLYAELAELVKTVELQLNGGRPFGVGGGIQIGSQQAEKIYNIGTIEKADFS